MPKRKPDLPKALARARDGKSRQLALLIKGLSVDDLADSIDLVGRIFGDDQYYSWTVLENILIAAVGAQQGRERWRKEWSQMKRDAEAKVEARAENKSTQPESLSPCAYPTPSPRALIL
jgi:hypothetical protein